MTNPPPKPEHVLTMLGIFAAAFVVTLVIVAKTVIVLAGC